MTIRLNIHRSPQIKAILTFLLLSQFQIGCLNDKKEKAGLLIERNGKGEITAERPYVISSRGDTLEDGIVKYYYSGGQISDSFKMEKGVRQDQYYSFFEDGSIKSIASFKDGKRDGLGLSFFKSGVKEIEEMYVDDKRIYSKNFYPAGNLKVYFIFENDQDACYYLVYDSIGTKEESGDSLQCLSKSIVRLK